MELTIWEVMEWLDKCSPSTFGVSGVYATDRRVDISEPIFNTRDSEATLERGNDEELET